MKTKYSEPIDLVLLYRGVNDVVTGITALNMHALASGTPGIIEFETISDNSGETSAGVIYINSGFLEEHPLYDEDLDLYYTSINKAILDTLTYTTDNSALEEALNDLNSEGKLQDVTKYLEEHNFDMNKWESILEEYLDQWEDI